MNRKKILILGGSFDPIHNGHIEIAAKAAAAIGADEICLLPAGNPPYKRCRASQQDRLAMAELAAKLLPGAYVSRAELFREGNSYTADTLSRMNAEEPDAERFYLIGADKLEGLPKWKGFDALKALCTFVIAGRPGTQSAEDIPGLKCVRLSIEGPDIAASEIRRRAAEGLPLEGFVPDSVAGYIAAHGLYLCDYSNEEILDKLRSVLKPSRVTHILGVAETARRLAPGCGVDPQRAYLAGLLHDCAKYMPFEAMQALVRDQVPDTDEQELNSEPVLHAPAGSVLAEREYGVRDPAILNAIRRHTIGDEDMSMLDMLIYTADFVEPGRKPFPGLENAREAAERDIREATILCTELTHSFVRANGGKPHPKSIIMMQKINREEQKYV